MLSMSSEASEKLCWRLNNYETATYDQTVQKMNEIFDKTPPYFCAVKKLNEAKLEQGESVKDYLFRLYNLARDCNFGEDREIRIRDQLISGLPRKMFIEIAIGMSRDISLDDALQKCYRIESSFQLVEMMNNNRNQGRGNKNGRQRK